MRVASATRVATVEPVWLTTDELAERLKVPTATIHQWRLKRYGPPAVKMGRFLRFRLSDVERWEEEQEALSRARR
jgi:excisionase family DNA binding protein